MISLYQILNEILNQPKALILAGGAGSGKTHFIKNKIGSLNSHTNIFTLKNSKFKFKYLNPDDFVEKENLPLGKAMEKFRNKFSLHTKQKANILWDTTGANIKNTLSKIQEYDIFMIMVYTHPLISILQNFKRDRKLPLEAVIKVWNQVYNNIKPYQELLKNKFIIINNEIPGYEDEVKIFDKNLKRGKKYLKLYLEELINQNPQKFQTSFFREFNFSNLSLEEDFFELLLKSSYDKDLDERLLNNLKKEFQKKYEETGKTPNKKFIELTLTKLRNDKDKKNEEFNNNLDNIVEFFNSSKYREIPFIEESEIQNRLNQWVKQ